MRRDHRLLPFVATFLAIGLLSLMDAFMKGVSIEIGAYSAALLRAGIAASITLPLWVVWGEGWPDRSVVKIHVRRGIVAAFMGVSFFFALTRLELAVAISLAFTAPILALFLAAILLGEKIGRPAIIAAIFGLIGTVVIIYSQITSAKLGAGSGLGLLTLGFSALLYSWNLVLQRQQALLAKPIEIATFQSSTVFCVLLAPAPWLLSLPTPRIWADLSISAGLTVVALLILAWAYARAQAQALVPVEYTGFLWASLFGWLFYSEQVGIMTIAGAGLIIIGCLIGSKTSHTEQVEI